MADVVGRAVLEIEASFNTSSIQKSIDQLASLINKNLTQATAGAGKAIQSNLQSAFKSLAPAANQAATQTSSIFQKAGSTISRGFDAIGNAASAVFGTVSAVARVAGVAISGLAAQALFAGIEFNKLQQQVRGALAAILGGQSGIEDTTEAIKAGKEATVGLLAAVNELNDSSPFSRQSFLSLTQTLAGFGVEAGKIPGVLDAIQQAVAATGGGEAELLGLGQAFARIASSGKITGDIIQTFASRGIDLLSVLSKEANRAGSAISDMAGKSGNEIRDAISSGALDATRSIAALTSALTKDFAGATENVRKNFGGALDTFKARLRNIGGDLTKAFIDPIQGGAAVDALNNMSDALKVLRTALVPIVGPILQRLADLLRFITAGIRDFAKAFGTVGGKVKQFTDGTNTASDALQGIFDKIKGFLPLLAFFGAKFGGTFLGQIPVIGQFLTGLNPIVLAIGALIAVTPELRTAFADVAKTLLPLVKNLIPLFSQLLSQIGAALGPVISALVGALVPAFVAFGNALETIIPRLGPLVAAIGELLIKLTPLVTLIANGLVGAFNLVVPLIEKAVTVVTNLVTAISNVDFAGIISSIGSGVGDAVGGIAEKATEGTASIGELNETFSSLITTSSGLAQAFLSLNFSGIISGVQELFGLLGTLEDQLGTLGPIFTAIAATVAGLAAAFVVLNIVQTVTAAKAAIMTAVQAGQLAMQISLTAGTNVLTASVQGLAASMGFVIGPVAATVAIVAALAAVFVVLYLRVQPVRDAVDGLVDAFLDFLPTMDQLKAAFEAIKPTLETIGNILKVVISVAIVLIVGYIKLMIEVWKALAAALMSVVKNALEQVGRILSAFGEIFKALAPIVNIVKENFKLFAVVLGVALLPVIIPLIAAIGAIFAVLKLLPPILKLVANIINGTLNFAVTILVDGLKGLADIIEFVVGAINRFFDVLRFIGNIVSEVAQFLFGFRDAIQAVVDGFLSFGPIKGIVDAVRNAIGNLVDTFTSFGPVKAIIDGIGSAFDAAGKIIDGIVSKLGKAKGLLNKLTLGKLFKDSDDGAKAATASNEKLAKTYADIAAKAASAVVPTRTLAQVQKDLSTASDALKTSLEEASKKIDPLLSAGEALKNAQNGVKDAQEAAAESGKKLNELQLERSKILRDTITPTKEIAKAERELTAARSRIDDIDREVIATEKELQKLRGIEADEQRAAGDRGIERAKIALNRARQAEIDLLAAANAELNKNNGEQAIEVDLTGLSLDQARAKLAAVRATLAAQKQGAAATQQDTTRAKTAQELEDEKKSARLDVLDAEQALRDSERSRIQFDLDNADAIRENEQKLVDLQGEKIDAQEEINLKQNALNDLRAGETTLAKALKAIDDQILAQRRQIAAAQEKITAAKKAEKDAQVALNIEQAKFTGNIARQAELEAERFRLRAATLNLEPQVRAEFDKTLAAMQLQVNKVKELNGELKNRQQLAAAAITLQTQGLEANKAGDSSSFVLLAQSIQNLADALGPEAAVRQAALIAKITGKSVPTVNAMGSLVTKPIISHVGEGYKPELILPMTKPDRVWQLVSQHLPKFPGAMKAVHKAIAPHLPKEGAGITLTMPSTQIAPSPVFTRSRGTTTLRKGDGPMTRDQADKMIELLAILGDKDPSLHIEAPVQVQGQYNEEMVARKIEQRILRAIERRLR